MNNFSIIFCSAENNYLKNLVHIEFWFPNMTMHIGEYLLHILLQVVHNIILICDISNKRWLSWSDLKFSAQLVPFNFPFNSYWFPFHSLCCSSHNPSHPKWLLPSMYLPFSLPKMHLLQISLSFLLLPIVFCQICSDICYSLCHSLVT